MKRSEQIDKLAAALAEAAKSFPTIERSCTAHVKTKSGAEYDYSYADLNDVLSAVRGPLAANGITVSHDCVVMRGQSGVEGVETTCCLQHASGEWRESSPLFLPVETGSHTPPAQQIGGLCTYGKRYTVQDMLGLSTEADDDGNAASGNTAVTSKRESLPPCPKCAMGSKAVIVGKPEYGGGLVCFKKKDGCGHTWAVEGHEFVDKAGDKIPMIPESPNGTIVDKEVKDSVDAWRRFITMTGDNIQAFNGTMVDLSNTSVTPAAAKRIVWAAIQKHAKAHGWELVTAEDGSKYFAEAVTH